ncbi:DNA-binding protein WhiA [Williamsoniiplasma somnilux]|uniref:Probable cell division protein WhiA n=1 Tax=Williamsoniiplasma somnilux TaxID=215578 RepID=A0A2K8NZ09_9MOLU|nr:DNA-binding protein WhiA [Williamsoniiplasma somnilux]ATZ19027.1 DNA-binding protein WhiA [Williamsoniiplasma somnilux]
MSFALKVKEEIISHSFSKQQKQQLLAGFIKYNADLVYTNGTEKLKLSTVSNRVARTIFSFCKELFNGQIEISIVRSQILKKNQTFQLTLIGNVGNFLNQLHIYVSKSGKLILASEEAQHDSELMRAYIAGIFIAVGSVNSPTTTNYHLEVQFKELDSANYFLKITKNFSFDFKVLKRNSQRYVCYIKKSAMVSDFLKLIDASQAVLDFENKRISRDMFNNINRIANIDISNQTKTSAAADKQLEQIQKIKKSKSMHLLSNKAQALCDLRIKNPESSFSELETLMNKNGFRITKSGVSNLFKTIAKFSEEV